MEKLNPAHKPHHEKILFFAIAKKAQISSVTTQVDQNFAFFATLILNLPALIEKSPKILNPKLKDKCLFLYLRGRTLADLEPELQRNVFLGRG